MSGPPKNSDCSAIHQEAAISECLRDSLSMMAVDWSPTPFFDPSPCLSMLQHSYNHVIKKGTLFTYQSLICTSNSKHKRKKYLLNKKTPKKRLTQKSLPHFGTKPLKEQLYRKLGLSQESEGECYQQECTNMGRKQFSMELTRLEILNS